MLYGAPENGTIYNAYNQYFTVPHIVHRTPVDIQQSLVDIQKSPVDVQQSPVDVQQSPVDSKKKMTRLACPVIVHWMSSGCLADFHWTFAQFCINFNEFIYYYLILSKFIHLYI